MFYTIATYSAAVDYKITYQSINQSIIQSVNNSSTANLQANEILELCLPSMRNEYSETPYDAGGPPILTRAASRYSSPYYCTP